MLARPDIEQKGWLWVDRGIDGRADHFAPCLECAQALGDLGQRSAWHELDLCQPCATRLEINGAIDDVLGQRPLIFPPELQRVPDTGTPLWHPLGPVDLRPPRGEEADFPPFRERVP